MKNNLQNDLYELVKKDSRVFDLIQEGSLDGLWYWNLENPKQSWMSQKLWIKLGYNPNNLTENTASWETVINQEDLKIALENFEKFRSTPKGTYEQTVRYTDKKGAEVFIRTRALSLPDEKGKNSCIIGTRSNVSAVKKLEKEVRKKDKFWRETLERMNFGFQIIDRDYRYLYLNKKTEEYSKFPPGTLIGKTMLEMYPGIENTDIFRAIEKVAKSGEIEIITNEFTFPNGELEIFHNIIQPIDEGIGIYSYEVPSQYIKQNLELKEKKELLYKLTQQIPGVIYQFRMHPDGRSYFPYVSDKLPDLNELSALEVKDDAEKVFSHIHPDDYDRICLSIKKSFTTLNLWEEKYRVLLPNKGERWFHGIAQPEKMEDDSVMWSGFIQDITETQLIEESLKETRERSAAIFKSAQIPIVIKDKSGNIKEFNQAAYDQLGYTPEEYSQLNITQIDVTNHTQEKINQLIADFKDKGSTKFDARHKTKNGAILDIMVNASQINIEGEQYTLAVFNDVTPIKQATKKIEDFSNRLNEAQKMAKLGNWDFDLINNTIYWSDEIYRILDMEVKEIEANYDVFVANIHPEDRDMVNEAFYNSIQNKQSLEIEFRLLTKNNNLKFISSRGYAEYDENGTPLISRGIIFDISERKKIENILAEKNKQLEQFTYISSHDLQEPLNTIISFSNLLKEEINNVSPVGQKSIEIIASASLRMKEFIKALLEYSKIGQHATKKDIDISILIENLKLDLSDLIDKKQATIQYIGKPLQVQAYKEELMKLFQNLIVNGIRYTSEDTKPIITINSEERQNNYLFSVTDNGIGIEPKHFDKIFEVFQRLHRRDQYEGTGIGLSFCKKVVDLHDGQIWLDSEVGKGSTFYFTIAK